MEKYQDLKPNVKKMYIAELGVAICTLVMLIPIVGTILGGIGVIVFGILNLIALYGAGKTVEGCKMAFIFSIANLVIGLLTRVPVLGKVLALVGIVLGFLVVQNVCSALSEVMKDLGSNGTAEDGDKVVKIYLVCSAASLVITILSWIKIFSGIAVVLNIVLAVVEVVAIFMFVSFLKKCSDALGA